jgi:hypothetical protein
MKMMDGAFFSASWNTLRRLLSLSPASLLMISGPLTTTKKAPVSLATARAMSVLPLPGGPTGSQAGFGVWCGEGLARADVASLRVVWRGVVRAVASCASSGVRLCSQPSLLQTAPRLCM